METNRGPQPINPEGNNPEKKIFVIADKLRGVYLQLEKDIREGITEETFDNLEQFIGLVQELKSLDMTGVINSLLSTKAVNEDDLENIDTIGLGSQVVDSIERSIQQLNSWIPAIQQKIDEEKLNHAIKNSAGTLDSEEVIPQVVLNAFKDEAGKIGSGIHVIQLLLSNTFDPSATQGTDFTEGDLKSSLNKGWEEFNQEREKQEKDIENLLDTIKQEVCKHFSIKPGMDMMMLHASPDTKTSFSGVISFLSMADDSSRELSFSGEYDASKNTILKVTFEDKQAGTSFTQEQISA